VEPSSRYVAEDLTLTLGPVEDAAALLADLLELRWQGLRMPLTFFPESALAWLESGEYGNAFHQAWSGDRGPPPEESDPAVRIAFRGLDPIDEAFEAHTRRILQLLLAHSETVRASQELQ